MPHLRGFRVLALQRSRKLLDSSSCETISRSLRRVGISHCGDRDLHQVQPGIAIENQARQCYRKPVARAYFARC
jgi:hypothetical protein